MFGRLLFASWLLITGSLLFVALPAHADPVTNEQLASVLLSPADLGAYTVTQENAPDVNSETFQLAYHRMLTSTRPAQSGYATVDLQIQLLASAVPGQLAQAYLTGGHVFDSFSDRPGFQHTGSLGIGNADDSMFFDYQLPNTDAIYAVYVDAFLRGRFLVTVRYGAVAGLDDPSALQRIAAQQDSKLQTSGVIPPALLNPLATPSQISSHRWYTSADPTATLYYCDDDPAWRAISLDELQSFGTVAELLAQFPGRTLNQPCADGATGP